jgi:hypothetical protein
LVALVFAIVAATLAAVTVVSPAHAATARLTIGTGKASCPGGYVCLWTLNNYTGTGYAFFNSEVDYAALPSPFNSIQDNSWSFYNNGFAGSFEDVHMYQDRNQTGMNFVLCRGDAIPELPPNAEVNPPTTTLPGRGWRDRVSSHKWGDFCG